MKNLVISIFISFIVLFYCNPTLAFDFAPEIGDAAPNFQLKGFNKNKKTNTKYFIYIFIKLSIIFRPNLSLFSG